MVMAVTKLLQEQRASYLAGLPNVLLTHLWQVQELMNFNL